MVPLFMNAMDRYFRDSIHQKLLPDENRSASIDIKFNPDNVKFNITLIAPTSNPLPEINNTVEYQVDQNAVNTDIIGYWMYMIPAAPLTGAE